MSYDYIIPVDENITTKNKIIYFKLLTLILTQRFGYNEELNYPLSKHELNIENLKSKANDINNKISLEQCIVVATKLLDIIDSEYDEFIEDTEDSNVQEEDVLESLDVYNKIYYDMLDMTYKKNVLVKNIFNNLLQESLEQAIKEEDYESASIINNKISQINS